MSKTYRYTGDPGRYYPTLGLTPGAKKDGYDGVEFELDDNPDEARFTERAPKPAVAGPPNADESGMPDATKE